MLRDPALRSRVLGEVGFSGATRAIGKEARTQKVVGKVVGFVGSVADDPMRTSAFLHEASAAGVISRTKPILTAKDREKLLRLFTDKSQRPLLNDIRSRSVEAMADFSRMTPAQRKSARRLLIIPGWLMAGSRYPFHFAATHPVRSALLAYIAMGEPGAPEKYRPIPPVKELFAENLPPWVEGIKVGDKVERTTSLSPVNTPWDLAQAAIETARGNRDFGTETAFDYANPVAAAGIRFGQGEGVDTFKRLAPNIGFVEGLIHPQASKYYPEDATRLGRLERELGIFPVKIRRSEEQFTPVQRARQRVLDKRDEAWMEAQRVGLLPPGQKFGKPIRAAFNLQAKRASAYAEAGVVPSSKLKGRTYQLAAFEQDVKLAVQIGALTQGKGVQALKSAQTKTAAELEAWRRMFSEQAFGGALLSSVYAAIREAGGLEE